MLLVGLYVLSDFGAVSLLRYETFTRAIYTQFRCLDVTPALFLSGVLVLVALVVVWAEQRARGKAALYSHRPARKLAPARLRGWRRVAAYVFLGTAVASALVLPLVTLGWWAIRGLTLGSPVGPVIGDLVRSASVSAVAAVITVAASVPVAVLTVRHASRATRMLESVAWSTYSLPHLAVGLGFLVVALRFVPAVYQSVFLLVVAYMAMFLPQAMSAAQTGLRQVGPSLEEASRSLGVGPFGTLWRVTLPLLGRSLLAGGGIVFLSTMKELPATLLLRPTGFGDRRPRLSASSEPSTLMPMAALVHDICRPLYLLEARDPHRT